jgi:hypothetical protein
MLMPHERSNREIHKRDVIVPLGDSHNFGRRVVLRGQRVLKPRQLLWERLLLSNTHTSPLRKFLRAASKHTFDFLPTMRFSRNAVERIALSRLRSTPAAKNELATIVGRSLAFWAWMGVADLHWENLVLGVDARGRIVFGPLDIEMIFADLSLPTQTKLIPDADPEYAELCRQSAGLRLVLPYLGEPISAAHLSSIVAAYRATLELLEGHAQEIADIIGAVPELRTTPIRVLLRSTGDYVRARTEPISPPLLDAEAEQFARGDIPYFFRLVGQPGLRYYRDARLAKQGRVPVPLEPLLSFKRGLRSPSRRSLREQGMFTVIGAFDHPSLIGRHGTAELEIELGRRTIKVTLASGEELECPRNLRSIVGSVYQLT